MKQMKLRKSIRKYTSKKIDREILNELLEIACRASTTGNMQLYSIILTEEEAMKEKLAPAHFNQPMIKQAPLSLTFCADFRRFSKWCTDRNAEPGYNNFLSFLNATIDALLVAQTFCVAAEERGLGICYLGTVLYNARPIIDALELPPLVFPITTITVGYPAEDPQPVDRLPLEAIVHQERYKDYTSESINALYAHKESLAENLQFIQENKKETLAQVFTDVRYKKEDNERISEELLVELKKQGFL